MAMRDAWTTVQGLRIHSLRAGDSGSPVVLLHGGGSDSARLSWAPFIGPLAASGHRVWAPDLPGYGESDRPDVGYSTEFYLRFLDELLAALGLAQASLVGLSMGGALALGSALRAPARAARLVLVDSYGLQRTVAMQKLSYLMVRTPGIMEATWALMRSSRAMTRAGMRNVFHDVNAIPEPLLDELCAEARRPAAGRAFTAYQRQEVGWGGLRTVYLDRLPEIQAPTLLVHGAEDQAVPLRWALEAQRRIPGARLEVIAGAGHWPQREQPARFAQAVIPFLAD